MSFEIGKEKATSDEEELKNHIDAVPREIFAKFIKNIPLRDRVRSERVSRRWKRRIQEVGWEGQKKLDHTSVFEGAPPGSGAIQRFWSNAPPETNFSLISMFRRVWEAISVYLGVNNRSCNLVSLFHRFGMKLDELDLQSFGQHHQIQPFVPQIAKSLSTLSNLTKLNIRGFQLRDFVDHLPATLRELKSSGMISLENLETLANRCPNLQEVPFKDVVGINFRIVNEFLPRFPRQKKLDLVWRIPREGGRLSKIGQLAELEQLTLWTFEGLEDERVFDQFIRGPSGNSLRRLGLFECRPATEAQLLRLAELPNLEKLLVVDNSRLFTDAVLMAIAERGQLKGFYAALIQQLTDDSILHLIKNCKSLVSLDVFYCGQVTERSLEAVVAEVRRRHGSPPRALPNGPLDPGIFFFRLDSEKIDADLALALREDNPWLVYEFEGDPGVDPRIII